MQIYYCDGCQLRIDIDEEGVPAGDKVYCKTCATSKGISGTRPSRAGTSGFNRGITSVQRSTPAGSQRSTPSNIASTPRSTPGLGSRRPSSTEKIPARKSNPNAPPVIVPDTNAEPSNVLHDAANNVMLVYGLAGGGLLMAAIGIYLISNSSPTIASNKPTGLKPSDANLSPKPNLPQNPIKPETETLHKNGGPLGMLTSSGDSDPKEEFARREYDKILEQEKSGKLTGFALYHRYEAFVNSSARGTKAGKEADAKFKSFPLNWRVADNPGNTVPGLSAVYFNLVNGSMTESASRAPLGKTIVKNIDFENEHKLETIFGRHDFIFIRFSGFLQVPADGVYTFYAESDDGSKLYFGDEVLIDNDGDHPPSEKSDSRPLKAGKHRIRFDYFQGSGGGCVFFRWSGPGFERQIVPESALSN